MDRAPSVAPFAASHDVVSPRLTASCFSRGDRPVSGLHRAEEPCRHPRRHGDPDHPCAGADDGAPHARGRSFRRLEPRADRNGRCAHQRVASGDRRPGSSSPSPSRSAPLLGAVNGLLVWKLGLPSIVVTLGTLAVYRGSIYLLAGGAWVNSHRMSPAFLDFIRIPILGLTVLTWFAIVAIAAAFVPCARTSAGRNLFAAGSNPLAAVYSGIDPGRMQAMAFVISGAAAGLCGYFWVSRFRGRLCRCRARLRIAGHCRLCDRRGLRRGRRRQVAGVVIGALFLGIVKNALPLVGVSPFWQMAIAGAVITGAVVINARSEGRTTRRILEGTA